MPQSELSRVGKIPPMTREVTLILVLGTLLNGCGVASVILIHPWTSPSQKDLDSADFGSYPVGYQEVIRSYFEERLIDPESARYAFSEPERGYRTRLYTFDVIPRYTYGYWVAVEINAKNRYGGYTGAQTYQIFIRDDRILYETEGTDRF